MGEHPIENLMMTAMNSIQNMVDVNTIVGEPIQSMNGITIIPISKVSFGFAAGGSEFSGETIKQYRMKDKDEEIEYKLPFGGGAGGSLNIIPVAFLAFVDNDVKILHLDDSTHTLEKIIDFIPSTISTIIKSVKKEKKEYTIEK